MLGRPRRVAVRRRGPKVFASWRRVAGATGYEVAATAASGEQVIRTVKRPRVTLAGLPRHSAGTVAVRATSPLRDGVARVGRFRAVAKRPPTRFGPLPSLRLRPARV